MAVDSHITDPRLSSALRVSAQARDEALALVDLIQQARSEPGPVASEAAMELCKQKKQLNVKLALLRSLHRQACFGARDTKAETLEARQEIDQLHLQLQNLYYEQRHLEGEIETCQSFDHKYQDLPLIPVEEFLASHLEYANVDENELMIARINHERAAREELEKQRQELLKRKQKLIADNKKRRDDLASLDKDLEKFIDAAKPIQKLFENMI